MWHCNFRFCRMKSDEIEFFGQFCSVGTLQGFQARFKLPARSRSLSLSHSLSWWKEIAYEDPIPLSVQQQLIALT